MSVFLSVLGANTIIEDFILLSCADLTLVRESCGDDEGILILSLMLGLDSDLNTIFVNIQMENFVFHKMSNQSYST